MQRPWISLLPLIVLIGTAPAMAQDAEEERQERPEPINLELKVTDKMIFNWLDYVADDMAGDYELSDDQYYQVNEILHDHMPRFLRENREDIGRVLTEFAEVFGDNEAPDSITVAEWADRARPLLDKFRDSTEVMADDFREIFDDGQIVKLDGYLAVMDTATGMVGERLTGWSEGSFDADTDWWGGSGFGDAERERRVRMEKATVAAKKEAIAFHLGEDWEGEASPSNGGMSRDVPPPPGARGEDAPRAAAGKQKQKTSDKWKQYTEDFIVRYNLDQGQTQRARLFYDRAAQDRDRYERSRLPELRRIADMSEKAKSERDKAAAKQAKTKYEAGIERMFKRLKDKLDSIPTRPQRVAAREAEKQPKRSE